MKWRVMIRSSEEQVHVWIGGLSADMAESTAELLRMWMPRSILGAWAEPEWAGAVAAPMTGATSVTADKIRT